MEENKKEIVEETATAKEVTESEAMTPSVAAAPETDVPADGDIAEKKPALRRKTPPKTTAAPQEIPEKKGPLRLKPSRRHGFQFKGRYFSRTELGRKSVLEKLYKQYPGLFEK